MLLDKKKISFTDKVLNSLAAMGKVVASQSENNTYLLKDMITFAKIISDEVYLRAPVNYGYVPVDKKTLQNHDLFLRQATNAYWLAKEEKEKSEEVCK